MTVKKTLLVWGESNAVGFNSLTPAQSYDHLSRIHNLNGSFEIVPAADPIVPGNFGIGPLIGFADGYITLSGDSSLEVCGIVGLGIGATASVWSETSFSYTVSIKAAMKAEAEWGPVSGLLWLKGINEATAAALEDGSLFAYPLACRRVFANIRVHLNNPELPIMVCRMPAVSGANAEAMSLVDTWITQMPTDVPHLAVIAAADLTTNSSSDPFHFTGASAHTIGSRAANALNDMM